MILLDYSAIFHAAFYANPHGEFEEGFLRHMILNSIRMHNLKFRGEYGRMCIACDGMKSWRKDAFPLYKANRKQRPDQTAEEEARWKEFYRVMNLVLDELREFFPYIVIKQDGAEADDIIAVITRHISTTLAEANLMGRPPEKVMIISSDKDFNQLLAFPNVSQFSPALKKKLVIPRPQDELRELILTGDSTDGVPNILSPDDCFVKKIRQKPLTAKRKEPLISCDRSKVSELLSAEEYRNFCRNECLIDFDFIPTTVSKPIIEKLTIAMANRPGNSKILNYLTSKRCNQLVSSASEFFVS